ncbi:ABC transporter substrate-binding protein [Pseudooceanicola sp. CBS1P-1]|uniref:Extracellular solute-binding protein n=1 Tax=Pseudooceanicola albus TaxID=2692189 RepID=A0A6L7G7Z5_9RHOB|nr:MULTISPECIES: ABC transporter substrate-binding protein [Pseudooceanicola]MBT9386305.1 ABC transporter substrate-binding protein [Pseudooceanicola endophyticus]MXN20354.1 extracellular solute-binding protein [Pseudooceanicola albus]
MQRQTFQQDAFDIARHKLKTGQLSRRQFVAALSALGLSATIRPGAAHAAASEIVVCNWGGAAIDAFRDAYGAPFTKSSGIEVVVDGAGPSTGAVRAMVEAGNVIWDATDGGMTDAAVLGKGGYVDPIDYSVVDKSRVGEGMAAEYGVANYIFSNVLAYDATQTDGKVPAGWKDFFDFDKFPGQRTMCKWVQGQLEAVLMADGVKPEDMYPLDVDRAFAKLEPYLKDIIFWESGAQSQQLLREGEVVMGNIWHTRANLLRKENPDLTWTWENQLIFASAWSVPKGNPAGKEVFEFINSSLLPEGQVTLLRAMGNGPTNPAALALMSEEDKAVYSLAPENLKDVLHVSAAYYAEHDAEVQNRFLDFISR